MFWNSPIHRLNISCSFWIHEILLSLINRRERMNFTVYMVTLTVFCSDLILIQGASCLDWQQMTKYISIRHETLIRSTHFACSVWIRVVDTYLLKRDKKLKGACTVTEKSFRAEYQSLHLHELLKFPTDEGSWSHRRTKWRNHYVFVRLSVGAPSPFSIVCMWFIRTVIYYLRLYTFYCV